MPATKKNVICILLVIVIATVFFLFRGAGGVRIDPTGDGLTFTGSAGSTTLRYADITDIRYFSAPDYGGGESSRGFRTGVWDSPELGTYTAYVSERINGCVLFISDTETVAFNYESDDTTRGFYESVRELWLNQTGG